MTKQSLLQEILIRVGDPLARSETYRTLAWSHFIEKAYAGTPNLSLVEGKDLLLHKTVTLPSDAYGKVSYPIPWSEFTDVANIVVHTEYGAIPTQPISALEYANMISNPFFSPCNSDMGGGGQENFHYYDGKNLVVITPSKDAPVTFSLHVYPDLRDLLASLNMDDKVPLHNSYIQRLIPEVVEGLKADVGLTL